VKKALGTGLLVLSIAVLASCGGSSVSAPADSSLSRDTAEPTTTVEAPTVKAETFCDVANAYRKEITDVLANDDAENLEGSVLNTKEFWDSYKDYMTRLYNLAPDELTEDASLSFVSSMAAYEFMAKHDFDMAKASEDPDFATDERFNGEEFGKAGARFQTYIDNTCTLPDAIQGG
jgi:hypothetical protein